jgi:uncharacterized protein YyaL (SSP411 family)
VNRLGAETSPYLRQHAADPVDWYPWGEEALREAAELDRPLFISIGYSSCHWCHVMGHESFSDPAIAELMNSHFVSVKVDREERPDLDAIYMEAVQAATGKGGWPMSIFATPTGQPFLAGTYFPDRARYGMPAFRQVLEAVIEAWATRREDLVKGAQVLTEAVASRLGPSDDPAAPDGETFARPRSVGAIFDTAVGQLGSIFDADEGGFGSAPKFPQPLLLDLLLRDHVRSGSSRSLEMVETTLLAMASGGIYDQLGGGFARYSVDRHWSVPHFEKMLYDQALIARVYLHAWQIDGDPRLLQVLDETISYVLSELRPLPGGICAAEDADSEGEEGLYYLWTSDEVTTLLKEAAKSAAEWYGVSAEGNFEGHNVLFRARRGDLLRPLEIEVARAKMRAARAGRARPGLDDKVVTEWNAMMCSTLAEAAAATGRQDWATAAKEIAEWLLKNLRREDGRVLRSWCQGKATLPGYAADYAWLIDCCTRLGELLGETKWTLEAAVIARELIRLFADEKRGFLYTTGCDVEALVVRPRDAHDGVTPAAGSVAALALARLGALLDDDGLRAASEGILNAARAEAETSPLAFAELIGAAALAEQGPIEIVITGERPDLVRTAQERFLPGAVLAWRSGPLLAGREEGFAYVCRQGACLAPVDNPLDLLGALGSVVEEQ